MLQVNREFALAAACCRWPPSIGRNAAILTAASQPIDWGLFAAVVKRHRVSGLVRNGLSAAEITIPAAVSHSLTAAARLAARMSLLLSAEALRLQELFDREGCACAFVKGSTLAALAYGDCGIRQAKDIDVIVPIADVAAASALLVRAGYRRTRPAGTLSGADWTRWLTHAKDTEWRHVDHDFNLELHWRLTDISFLLKEPPDFAALQTVILTPTLSLRTLPAQYLFVYLCVHGAAHGWSRLKWLADVNALLANHTSEQIDAHYAEARALGAERPMGQAMLLCEALFGLPLPRRLGILLRSSRATSLLARIGLLCMTRGNAATDIYDQAFGTTMCTASHVLMATSMRAAFADIWRKGINLEDVTSLALPARFAFLYRFLRAPLWLYRRAANGGASRPPRHSQRSPQ